MKKHIFSIVTICAMALCLGGCSLFAPTPSTTDDGNDSYDALNTMLHADYSQIAITVTNTFDADTVLKSEYTLTYAESSVTVTYQVERFSELSLDGATTWKTTLTGEAVIENGTVVSTRGDDIGLTADIAEISLNFREEYFENVQLTGIFLIADVKDPSGFFGSEVAGSDMKVDATFLNIFCDMNITYTATAGNQVEIQYNFT